MRPRLNRLEGRHLNRASFWLENLALPGCALALEALALGTWLQLWATWFAGGADQALLPSWALWLILLAAFWLARWLAARRLPGWWPALLIVISWAILLLLVWYLRLFATSLAFWQVQWLSLLVQAVQTESGPVGVIVGLLFLVALLWWRGVHLGRARLEDEQIARSFKVGFAALVVALLLLETVAPAARSGLAVQLGLALPLFLFVGLAALSLARLAEIRRRRETRLSLQTDPTRSWTVALLVVSGALVLLTLGIEQLFSYQTWLALLTFLQPVWQVIGTVLGWIALGLAYVFYWIFHPLVEGLRSLLGGGKPSSAPAQPPGSHPPLPGGGNQSGIPAEWLLAGRWVAIGVGVLLLCWLLFRAFRSFASWRRADDVEEERESLGTARVLGAQLRALLASLAARFQRPSAEGQAADETTIPTIRLLYRRILHQSALLGITRRAAETPHELAERLGAALSGQQAQERLGSEAAPLGPRSAVPAARSGAADPDLEVLTATYEQSRYGNHEPAPAQLTALRERTERLLRRLGHREA
jgi:hypothetical protein